MFQKYNFLIDKQNKFFSFILLIILPLEIFTAYLYCFYFGIHKIKKWEWLTKPSNKFFSLKKSYLYSSYVSFNNYNYSLYKKSWQ